MSKIVNGVKKLKVEDRTKSGTKSKGSGTRKGKMESIGRTVTFTCKPCGKGPFGSVEEADAHYWSGKHRGKSFAFSRFDGAAKISVHCINNDKVGTAAILRHFSQFGAITCAVVGGARDNPAGAWINIFYAAEAHAREAKKERNVTFFVGGVKKQIMARENYIRNPVQPRPEEGPVPEPRDPLLHDQVVAALVDIPDPSDQIVRFVEVAQMTAADVAERVEICRNVEATLSRAPCVAPGAGVSVYPFGSSVNGLGFRGCDLDVYVEMTLNIRRPTDGLDDHELSVRKVDVTGQVLRTIQQVSH